MSGRGNKKLSRVNPNRKWYLGIYVRRSFDEKSEQESNTIVNQKEMILNYVKNIPNITVVDIYVDDGYTGTDFNRPGFKSMFNDVVNGRINSIIVKDLSRLGRNHLEVGKYIENIFPIYDLRIIAINDNVDSFKNPESINSLMVPIKNLMNEGYAKDISDKVSSTYKSMARNGKFVAGTAPYGYTFDPNDKHHLIIEENEAEIVKKIFEMALNGDGRIRICKYLNDNGILCRKELNRRKKNNLSLDPNEVESLSMWGTTTIGRMLVNETYIGNLVQLKTTSISYKDHRVINKEKEDWIRIENTHNPIIDVNIFKKVSSGIKERECKKGEPKKFSIFNGILKCGDCGKAMLKTEDFRGNRNVSYYSCGNYTRTSKKCTKHRINTKFLEECVLESIKMQVKLVIELEKSLLRLNILGNYSTLEEEKTSSIRLLEIKIENLNTQKFSLYTNWKQNIISKEEFMNESKDIEEKINATKEEIAIINSNYIEKRKRIKHEEYWISHYKRNRKIKKLTKLVLDELVDTIYVYENNNVKIIFKYQNEYNALLNTIKEGCAEKWQSGILVNM